MPPSGLDVLHVKVASLEDELARQELALEDLEARARTMKIEADAARNPQQFRAALLERRARLDAIAGPLGFFLGLFSSSWFALVLWGFLRNW